MTPVADAEARALISRDGLGQTLFVEAGAGTGKTTQLVDRVVNLVLHGGVALADIAAITFTEAAATELQDRIRVRFEQVAAETDDEEERARCRQAIADADLAAISTLHGFAKRILSEHPIAAGLPPRVDILDEVSSQLAHEARWEHFVDELYNDPDHEELLVRAALLDVALEPRYRAQSTMKDVAAALSQSWDRLEPISRRSHPPLRPIDLAPFRRAVADLESITGACTDPSDVLLGKIQKILPQMRSIVALQDPRRALRALAQAKPWLVGGSGRMTAWPCVADARQAVKAVNEAREALLDATADEVLQRLLTLIGREVLAAAEARQAEGRLEFHDLLVLARRLLVTSADARRSLHHRYQRLLLDEFQDTDPIQIELAVLIAAAVDGNEPEGWEQAEVAPGRLFFVGDPKQSIYRFRRADIALFLRARDHFAPGRSWQRLVTNFRTVQSVVEWNNALFAQLMATEIADAQPRYEPLVAHRTSGSDADHRPVLMGHGHAKGSGLTAPQLRQLEATDVARMVDDVRRHPERWPVHEPGTGWRPARLPDITILVPTRTSLPFLRDALQVLDLPYRLDTGTLVYATQEVRDALAALQAVDDPTDTISVVAALRSPLYACSDVDLVQWRQAGGTWQLGQKRPVSVPDDHPVALALDHLGSLRKQRWWSGPSELLHRLLTERQAFLLAFGHDRPAEVWRRLRFLVDQARSFEEAGGGDLRAFLDWAELQGNEGSRVHEPLLPETDDHAVRIMTVHGSKGLEFPITILSGMTTQPGRRRPGVSLVWDEEGQPQLRLRKGLSTGLHDPRADLESEMDQYEKLRLLYVAATRARDHLVVSCHHKTGDKSYAEIVWERCQAQPGLWRTLPDAPSDPSPPSGDASTRPPTVVDDREDWVRARQALLDAHQHGEVVSATTIAREATAAELADEDDDHAESNGDEVVVARRRGRAGTAIGRAVHATLQVVDLADPRDVDAQAARQADLEAVPEAAPTVAAMVLAALSAPSVQMAVQARRHHKEVYVAAPIGERVIEGYVDLLIETDEGLVIVDYKTDTVATQRDVEAKVAAYELQGAAYAVALEQSTGMPVVDCRFVFCRPGGVLERSVVDLAGAMERVRRHVGG